MTDTVRKRTVNRAAETKRKSAERQRRREAGYKRMEFWLSPAAFEALAMIQKLSELPAADIINDSITGLAAAYEWMDLEPGK